MTLTAIAIVCAGGALGALARFWTTRLGALFVVPNLQFPLPTLFVNLLGSALLGALFGATNADLTVLIDAPLLVFAGVGFCGAFTTFSSFCTESVALVTHSRIQAALYVATTTIGSVIAFIGAFSLV